MPHILGLEIIYVSCNDSQKKDNNMYVNGCFSFCFVTLLKLKQVQFSQ